MGGIAVFFPCRRGLVVRGGFVCGSSPEGSRRGLSLRRGLQLLAVAGSSVAVMHTRGLAHRPAPAFMKRPRCSKKIVRGLSSIAASIPLAARGKERIDECRARQWIEDMRAWYSAKSLASKEKAMTDHNEQG